MTHTIRRQNENEWMVGHMEQDDMAGGVMFTPMFGGLSIHHAVCITNYLNGGTGETPAFHVILESTWNIAERKCK